MMENYPNVTWSFCLEIFANIQASKEQMLAVFEGAI